MNEMEYKLYRETLNVLAAIEGRLLEENKEEAMREIALYRREINRRIERDNK